MPVLPLTSGVGGPPSSSLLSRLSSAWEGGGGGKQSSTSEEQHHHQQQGQQSQQAGRGTTNETERVRLVDAANAGISPTNSTTENPIPSTSSSQAAWRYKLHKALRGKVMLVTNAWTATLVLTILLAVVFRALQPSEEPGIGVAHYAWRVDPLDPGRLSLAELDLQAYGVGRFMMDFGPSTVEVYPMEADEEVNVAHRNETVLDPLRLAELSIPNWSVAIGHDGSTVSAVEPSGYFSTAQTHLAGGAGDNAQVILTANMYGYVTVFASLPSRIFMKCYVKTDVASLEGPRCESDYLPHINRGMIDE
jgi:hypothetical protein